MSTVNAAFRQFYPSYEDNCNPTTQQQKAALSIMLCRTSELGGHVSKCEQCEYMEVHYNSCRNRHCPLCQGVTKAVWVDQRCGDILNAPYFHIVFTVPQQLHSLIYQNQKLLYGLMYKSVSETLSELSRDHKYLGAQAGFFCVLHTWGEDLRYHPHLHVVMMAGGLTKLNKWQSSSKKFFIPVKVLSKKFRGKYLHYLKQYYRQDLLDLYNFDAQRFKSMLNDCYAENWYSYCKPPFSGPLTVIKYLGRYTHRIAIANSRIVSVDEQTVTFKVRDKKNVRETKELTLQGSEFIRRFLMHVLPKGFVKVRYYGILAARNKKTKLALCRKLTASPLYKPLFAGLSTIEIVCMLLGRDVTLCPVCRLGKLKTSYTIAPP
jgi:hypothetical protein